MADIIIIITLNQVYQMGGLCLTNSTVQKQETVIANPEKLKIQDVDIVKVKLKTTRDRIRMLINAKSRDIAQIDTKISQKIPRFQETGNKKQLIPLLKAKKDLNYFITNAQVRLRLVQDKIAEVQLQKMNIDTINVLGDANKYIKYIQDELQNKDWMSVLEEAKKKYQLQWPKDNENYENDPKFIALWDELGGNRIPVKKQTYVKVPFKNEGEISRNQGKSLSSWNN